MDKSKIIEGFSRMSEKELNQVLEVYKAHRPRRVDGDVVVNIPEYLKRQLSFAGADQELARIIEEFPTRLTKVQEPSRELIDRCRRIYEENCFCFDEIGETFVKKVIEYASSYSTRPMVLYGSPGCGKSHRASVFAKMLGIPYEKTDIPLAAYGVGISGTDGSYKNASVGLIAKGMLKTGSCNYLFNGEEIDKEARIEGRPSFSDQFLKILDQDASRFIDNRLGFPIDASHIVYVFTANNKDAISVPMLDRCDVVELSAPSISDIERIVRGAVIPKSIKETCRISEVSFSDEAVSFIVNSLWRGDDTSIRQYQNVIDKCVRSANYTGIYEERPVTITVKDAEAQIQGIATTPTESDIQTKRRIGFA